MDWGGHFTGFVSCVGNDMAISKQDEESDLRDPVDGFELSDSFVEIRKQYSMGVQVGIPCCCF